MARRIFTQTVQGQIKQKKAEKDVKDLKKEISRKASMANKRLARLERNKLTDTPAYRNWVEYGGGVKFSVKGKSYNELQAELSRVNHFIDNATSTVRGTNQVLKQMAKITGVKYTNVKDLHSLTTRFFELSSKVEQYLNSAMQGGSAIGYQKIWQVINEYVSKEKINLADSNVDVDSLIRKIGDLAESEYWKYTVDTIFDTFKSLG